MITQTVTITKNATPNIIIGRRGTYDTEQVSFDISWLKEAYGDGTATVLVKRPKDASAYPVAAVMDGDTLTWTVSATDTQFKGHGECEIFWYVDGGLAKSCICDFTVLRDIGDTTETPPDPYETWVEALTQLGAETLANAQAAEQSAGNAAQSAESAEQSADAAEQSESNAHDSEVAAKASELAAAASAQSAGQSASGAAQSAENAAISASAAALSATNAHDDATDASASADRAEQAAASIEGDTERAEAAARTAQGAATSAQGSASTATTKATEASQSASAAASAASTATQKAADAAGSASSASGSATAAAGSASSASASATAAGNAQTAAETAQGKAEDAQEAAETAAQSIEDSAAQIDTNTADILSLKSAFDSSIKQINGDTVTGSRATSGSVYIEYYFAAGKKYLLANTSQSAAIVAATQNVKGTNVQSITSGMAANGTKEFTATEDAKYLWVYGDGAFSYSIINLSSVGKRLNDVSDKVDNLSGEVKHELEISATASGYQYLDYNFEVGKRYLLENLYDGSVVANTVSEKSSSAATINSITGGATGKAMLCFEPTVNAPILRIYFTVANGRAKISEIGTINYNVESIESSMEKVSNYQRFTVKNGTNSAYYPVKAGKSYKVSNITVVPTSGASADYALQIYTRSTPFGENIDTVSSGLYPGRTVYFEPTNDANYLRMYTPAVGEITITIDEVGTLTEYFGDIDTKKPYQSGQIHFTVPVNQKRLYFTQGSENVAQDSETDIVNVNCVLMLPPTYTPIGDKTNLLMIVHGSGGGVTESTWFRDEATVLAFFQKFIDAGFAIFDCNGYKNGSEGQESWGVDTASIAYHKAYEYVVKNYNVTEEMCVYGFSMGGLNALNYCNIFPGGIKALGLGSPVVSLYNTIWVDASVQAKVDVSRAYGFAVAGTYEADTVGNCDAYTRIKTINDIDYYLQRLPTVKIWHGDSDTSVYYQYSQRLYNAIKNSGGFAYYRIVTGKGHEICYGGNAKVTNEIIMYFKRFVLT